MLILEIAHRVHLMRLTYQVSRRQSLEIRKGHPRLIRILIGYIANKHRGSWVSAYQNGSQCTSQTGTAQV